MALKPPVLSIKNSNRVMKKQKQTLVEKKAKARLAFLLRIIAFVEEVLPYVGKKTHYHQGRFHTNQVFELTGCRAFSFRLNSGHTEMGGNDIQVWFAEHAGVAPVLSIKWQVSPEEVQVEIFYDDTAWQEQLSAVLRNKKRIVAQIRRRQKLDDLLKIQDQERKTTLVRSQKLANRLGLATV